MRGLLTVVLLSACTFKGAPSGQIDSGQIDSGPDGRGSDAAETVFGPWSAPQSIAIEGLSPTDKVDDPQLLSNGRLLFSLSAGAGTQVPTIGDFEPGSLTVTNLREVVVENLPAVVSTPWISEDERTFLFSTVITSNSEVFRATRTATTEDFPIAVADWFNTTNQPANEQLGGLSPDQLHLVYSSAGPVNQVLVGDLYTSSRLEISDEFPAGQRVPSLIDPFFLDRAPRITGDRTAIVFTRRPQGTLATQNDLYMTTRARASDPFGPPVALTELNMDNVSDGDGTLTDDLRTIVFSSTRDGVERLYYSSRSPQ